MNLKWIEAANLMSIGNTPIKVEFGDYAKTMVVGKNGTGKSLLVEAISFLWFGKSYRKLTKAEIVNSINKKALTVIGEWEANGHTWKVKRGIKPDVLEVYKDGKEVDSTAAKRDFQKYIEEYALSFNYDSFKRIIALGTAGYKPFMDMTAQERRSFVEEILDIQIFSVMSKLNKDDAKLLKSDIQTLKSDASILEHKIETNKAVLRKAKENSQAQSDELRAEFIKLEQEVADKIIEASEMETDLNRVESEFDKEAVSKVKTAISKINQLQGQHNSTLSSIKKRLDFFDTNATCPTCEQDIAHEHKTAVGEQMQTEYQESEEFIKTLNERLQQAQDKIQYLDIAKDKINAERAKLSGLKREIEYQQSQIKTKRDQYERLMQKSSADLDDTITATKKLVAELKEINKTVEEKTQDIRDRELLTLILKDDGVKAKVVESYLPVINGKVNEYLKIMNANYGFSLDQNFKETMMSRGRESMSFNNLSQGQRMRVDLALMFTWRDVVKLRTGSYTNVLIMDEIMDSAADEDGIITLRKIIDSLSDTNTVIISHSEKHNKSWFSRILKVTNSGMFTKYEEIINQSEGESNIYE